MTDAVEDTPIEIDETPIEIPADEEFVKTFSVPASLAVTVNAIQSNLDGVDGVSFSIQGRPSFFLPTADALNLGNFLLELTKS